MTTSTTQHASPGSSRAGAGVPLDGGPPQVSIVIPAYKVASYISETLATVFAQTFTDFEVIIVNDGSPDREEFEHALQRYADRIVYLKQENRGASAARNTGLRAARGELIAFLDADDLWSPNYLAEQLKFIREYGCDLACADAMIFGVSADAGRSYMDSLMDGALPEGRVTFLELVNADRSLITSGVVVRRDLVVAVGLFDETLRNAQDFDLWLRLARHGARLAYQRKVLLSYRSRPNSLTGDAINSHQRELRVFDKIEQSYEFTPAERVEVTAVISSRRALLEYELGKLYLVPGDFARARESFANANSLRRSWKPRLALWLTRIAPGLFRTLYLRRRQSPNCRVTSPKEESHAMRNIKEIPPNPNPPQSRHSSQADHLGAELETNGIVVLPSIVSPEQLRGMQIAFASRLRRMRWNNFDGYQRTELYRHMVEDVLLLDQGFVDLALHPLVKEILARYLGPEYELTEAKGWKSLPTKYDFHGWHGDTWYDQATEQTIHKEIKLAMYLTDVKSGAFKFIKGSHRQQHPRNLNKAEVKRLPLANVIELAGAAGTVFMFDTSAIHRQSIPIIEPRQAIFYGYHDPRVPLQPDDSAYYRYHPLLLNAAFLGGLSLEDQRILGFGNQTNFQPAFQRRDEPPLIYDAFAAQHAAELHFQHLQQRIAARLRRVFGLK